MTKLPTIRKTLHRLLLVWCQQLKKRTMTPTFLGPAPTFSGGYKIQILYPINGKLYPLYTQYTLFIPHYTWIIKSISITCSHFQTNIFLYHANFYTLIYPNTQKPANGKTKRRGRDRAIHSMKNKNRLKLQRRGRDRAFVLLHFYYSKPNPWKTHYLTTQQRYAANTP